MLKKIKLFHTSIESKEARKEKTLRYKMVGAVVGCENQKGIWVGGILELL